MSNLISDLWYPWHRSGLIETYNIIEEENEFDKLFSFAFQAAEIEKSRLPAMDPIFADSNNTSGSTDSILSLLIPAPLRETLWTTVALYLGWRLVSRLR